MAESAKAGKGLADVVAASTAGSGWLGDTVQAVLPEVAGKAAPMEALRTLVSALSPDDEDRDSNAPEANQRKATRLVAQMPMLVASYHAARTGSSLPDPDPEL